MTFIDCNSRELLAQIGVGNVLAISGGRVQVRPTGITLPVRYGYAVTVDLNADDTYVVRRILKRGDRVWVKGELTDVYCDRVGEVAYKASCYLEAMV
jgi:hypothetical protein